MFSPITQRSLKIRMLYISVYAALILGGLTMILPFLIMLSGSVEPRVDVRNGLVPSFLFDQGEMWNRYLSSKYQASVDLLRMSWNDAEVDFRNGELPPESNPVVSLWDQFVQETSLPPPLYLPGFLRANTRMPSYTGRQFRLWLLQDFGNNLQSLNAEMGTQFKNIESIQPPVIGLVGPARPKNQMVMSFDEFVANIPPSRLIPWNVGGYYRSNYLPYIYGPDIASFNSKHGTNYSKYSEIPFSKNAPAVGRDDWFAFVSQVLRPDFVELNPDAHSLQQASGINKEEFITTRARPEDLRVVSADTLFADWTAKQGLGEQLIPQASLDARAFRSEQLFWKWQFVTMNYQRVLDEILIHGRAIVNTLILVILAVGGALIVNPLAAYALSRYKLRKTYHILLFCLATIAFPAEITMIPTFLQLKEFNLLNTFGALVLPTLANGYSIFLLKGFFDSLPKELYEAAELDGANEWTTFWHITMNLSKPILAVIALGAFASAYGTFFYALILAPDPQMWTIMVYIYQLRVGVDSPVVYASLILTAIPTLLVFIFCQNLILRGIVVPSDK